MSSVNFDQPDLARAIESLRADEIDDLPFGAIRLDAEGAVTYYSEAERRLSGSGAHRRLGLSFFTDVAPCMGTAGYQGRIEQALADGTLDIEFTHVGDFDDRDRELTVRAQSATGGGVWIFMRREY